VGGNTKIENGDDDKPFEFHRSASTSESVDKLPPCFVGYIDTRQTSLVRMPVSSGM